MNWVHCYVTMMHKLGWLCATPTVLNCLILHPLINIAINIHVLLHGNVSKWKRTHFQLDAQFLILSTVCASTRTQNWKSLMGTLFMLTNITTFIHQNLWYFCLSTYWSNLPSYQCNFPYRCHCCLPYINHILVILRKKQHTYLMT